MTIDYNILITYGGVTKKYSKGDTIFHEGAHPCFFYQVIEGKIKSFSTNNDGKELLQNFFEPGQSFGEPALLLDKPYPNTAQACGPSVVLKIGREKLLNLLKDYPEILSGLLYTFAERMYQKASAAQVWVCRKPEEKIMQFLQNAACSIHPANAMQMVPYTRQEIADFIGLRVETVIRTMIRLSTEKKIKIVDHKIYI